MQICLKKKNEDQISADSPASCVRSSGTRIRAGQFYFKWPIDEL